MTGATDLKSGVVGVVPVLTHAAIFAIAAEDEDAVVGGRRDRQHRQDVPGERRQPERAVDGEHRDHSARGQQPEKRQEQLDQRGDDRAVDDQQHARDRDEGDQGDLAEAGVADDMQIVGERGRARDVRLHPWRAFVSSMTLRTA